MPSQTFSKIDSHHHLWHYSEAEYPWIAGNMQAIRRDFLPADLATELRTTGIDGSVAVQARQTIEETGFLLQQARSHPFIRGVVGWVPLISPDVQRHLETFHADPRLKGVRHVLHDEQDDDYMLRKDFNAGISHLLAYRLVFDILIFAKHLPQTIKFVDQHPNQIFVVDHIAKPRIREGEFATWSRHLRELSRRENVSCKLSGVVTEADWRSWREEHVQIYLQEALEAFGPARVMFGSDWPVMLVATSYAEWAATVRHQITTLSADEQASIMGGCATRIYRL